MPIDKKISELTLGTPDDTDVIPFVDVSTGETKKATKADLKGDKGDTGDTGSQGDTGPQGDNAYVYIAYASDASGTGFTLTFNASLNYIAILSTDTEIPSPSASDFTGLWKNYKGAQGDQGVQGDPGNDGNDGADGVVQSIVAGTNVSVDSSDPANPVVSVPDAGAVDSVNSQTGDVTLDQDDIGDGTTNKQYPATDKTKLAGIEAGADVTDAGNVGSTIHGATGKTPPVDADELGLIDSAASNVLKKLTWANLKSTLKTYFDSLYAPAGSSGGAWTVLGMNTLASAGDTLIDVSSIAAGYDLFRLTVFIKCSGAPDAKLTFNNDTGSNYEQEQLKAKSTTISGAAQTSQAAIYLNGDSSNQLVNNGQAFFTVLIAKPLAAQRAKVMVQGNENASSNLTVFTVSGNWNNTTDLINRITVTNGQAATDFDTGSCAVLEACQIT